MMISVTVQRALGQLDGLQRQRRQTLLHDRFTGQQADQFGAHALDIGQGFEQIEHAAALGQNRLAGNMVSPDRSLHRAIGGQRNVVQLRVATGQVQAVGVGQLAIMDRREEAQLGAHVPQQVQARAIQKGKGLVARDGDAYAAQQRLDLNRVGRGKGHGWRQGHFTGAGQRRSRHVQTHVQIIELTGLDQPQMAAGQFEADFPGQCAVPAQAFGQAVLQQLRVAYRADAIGQHAGERQIRLIARQAQRQCAKRLRHGRAVDHTEYRHAKMPGQVGARWRAIEQAHDPLDQNQVRLISRFPQQATAFIGTDHPHVQLIDRRATGPLENHRVEKVRAALEHPDLAPLVAVQACQCSGHRGFALPGGRRSDQYRRAITRGSHCNALNDGGFTARYLSAREYRPGTRA